LAGLELEILLPYVLSTGIKGTYYDAWHTKLFTKKSYSWAWWYMSVIPAVRRLKAGRS
jgi:hypothetical protein